MKYALKKEDNSVVIMILVPTAINIDQTTWPIEKIFKIHGGITLLKTKAGNFDTDIAINDLEPDSISGITIVFPSVESQIEKMNKQFVSFHKIDFVPTEREFRNSWEFDGKDACIVNMPKARDIWRDKLREARKIKLEALDVEYMRADEAGDVKLKKVISDKKNELRLLPNHPDIEAAQTVDQLRQFWPL